MNNKTNPTIEAANELKAADLPLNYALDQFAKKLNKKPQNVATNQQQGNYKYLPISHVQNLLNQIFLTRWQVKNFDYREIHMQLCGTLELWVFNPITKEWLVRQGTAATQIRCDRNSGKPIKNGLSMDLPRLQADCIKNAAKSLGKVFGADLNRKIEDHYKTHFSNYVESQSYDISKVSKQVDACNNTLELLALMDSNPYFAQDAELCAIFEERKNELQRGSF